MEQHDLTPETTLYLDVGNSRIKWLLAGDDLERGRSGGGDQDALRGALHAWRAAPPGSVAGICVASVEHRQRIDALVQELAGQAVGWLRTRSRCGNLRCAYRQPEQLGVDRWAALAGARRLYPGRHCVIADYGSATTVDVLRADGRHLGGWIVPGLGDALEAVRRRLEHLRRVQSVRLEAGPQTGRTFGDDTGSGIGLGALHAQAALLEHAVAAASRPGQDDCRVIATGGNARRVIPFTAGLQVIHRPLLLFHGMRWLREQT